MSTGPSPDVSSSVMSRPLETEAKAYMNWINIKTKPLNVDKVTNLEHDFKDGVATVNLCKALTGKELRFLKNPRSEFQCIQNNNTALSTFRDDGCILHGADATSLQSGNQNLTRGFIWQLMLHYHINIGASGKSMAEVRREALDFINEQLATLTDEEVRQIRMLSGQSDRFDIPIHCRSFDQPSFSDGTVLAGLTIAINNDRSATLKEIEMKTNSELTSPTSEHGNTEPVALTNAALITAEERNEIPILVSAEDIIHSFENNSVLAYVSYFQQAKQNRKSIPKLQTPELKTVKLPDWDELAWLNAENGHKDEHKVAFPLSKPAEVSVSMPTIQKLQSDADQLDQMVATFDQFCSNNGPFEDQSQGHFLFARLKAHRARLGLDITNYQHGIHAIQGVYAELVQSQNERDQLQTQINLLSAQNEINTQKIEDFKDQLQKLSQESNDNLQQLQKELDQSGSRVKELDSARQQVKQLQEEQDQSTGQISGLIAQLAENTQAILANEIENDKFVQRARELELQKSILENDLNHLQAKNDQNDIIIRQLQDKLETSCQKCDELEFQNEKHSRTISNLTEKCDKLIKSLTSHQEKCESEHIGELAQLTASITHLTGENAELHAEVNEKDKDLVQKTLDAKKKDDELFVLRKQLSEANIATTDREDELIRKSNELGALQSRLESIEGESGENAREFEQLTEQLSQRESQLEEKGIHLDDLQKELGDLRSQVEKVSRDLIVVQEERNQLKDHIISFEESREAFSQRLTETQDALAKSQGRVNELQHIAHSNEAQLSDKESEMRSKYDELLKKIAHMEEYLEAKNSKIQEKNSIIDHQTGEIVDLNDQINKLKQNIDELQTQRDSEREVTQATNEQFNQQHKSFNQQLQQLQDENAQLKAQLKAQVGDQNQSLQSLEQDNAKMESDLKQLQQENTEKEHHLHNLQGDIANKDNELRKLRDLNTSHQQQLDNLLSGRDQSSTKSQDDLNRSKAALALAQQEIEDLKKKNDKLSEESDSVAKQLADGEKKNVQTQKQNALVIDRLKTDLEAMDLLKKDCATLKAQLIDHKKKKPDGSCACSCCDHSDDHMKKKDSSAGAPQLQKLQDDLEVMNSKYQSLKEETNEQRIQHRNELNDIKEQGKDIRTENDKLVLSIKRMQDKLKQQGNYDEDEDDVLTTEQKDGAEARNKRATEALDLLNQLNPQAGIAFSPKDPEGGGVYTTKVYIGKAAYIAGVLPGEVITTVNGADVVKDTFAEIWRNDARAGQTLLLQVNGVDDRGKKYHRTIKMDLGSNVATVGDVKALKRMSDGHFKPGDDIIIARVKKSQDDYLAGNHTTSKNKPFDSRDRGSKGYLDENDTGKQRQEPGSTVKKLTIPPKQSTTTPTKSTTCLRSSITTPGGPTATPTKPTLSQSRPGVATTPSRSQISGTPTAVPVAMAGGGSQLPNSSGPSSRSSFAPSSLPSRNGSNPSLTTPTRRSILPHTNRPNLPPTPVRHTTIASPPQRTAPPRGELSGPPPLRDSRFMAEGRQDAGKVTQGYGTLSLSGDDTKDDIKG